MIRKDINILQSDIKPTIEVIEDALYVIKAIGDITSKSAITFRPVKNDITINVVLLGFLSEKSKLELDIEFDHSVNISSFNYGFSGKVILSDNSRAKITPILKVRNRSVSANHKLSMGTISEEWKCYMFSKGFSLSEVTKIVRDEMLSY